MYYERLSQIIYPVLKNFTYGVLGVVLGTTINRFCYKFNKRNKPYHKMGRVFLQILLCSIALSRVYGFFPNFGTSWQSTVPGLFFSGFFFNTQYEMFDLIRSLNR